uniref:F-box domain-containing protein n=1 Tax=Amphimedon queenslandica TaxID=400682 RepID=A0A1X7UPG0_AMPQE
MDGSRDSDLPCSKRRKLRDYPDVDSNDSETLIINPSVVNQLPLLAGHGGQEKYTNPFDSLSNEVIQEICMMLSIRDKMSFQLVNRRLYSICSDPYLWRNVFIDDAHETNAPFFKSALQTCQPHVQSLSLTGQAPFSGYQKMIVSCQGIHTLNLYIWV